MTCNIKHNQRTDEHEVTHLSKIIQMIFKAIQIQRRIIPGNDQLQKLLEHVDTTIPASIEKLCENKIIMRHLIVLEKLSSFLPMGSSEESLKTYG